MDRDGVPDGQIPVLMATAETRVGIQMKLQIVILTDAMICKKTLMMITISSLMLMITVHLK